MTARAGIVDSNNHLAEHQRIATGNGKRTGSDGRRPSAPYR